MRITKDTLIGDILKMDMGMARILMAWVVSAVRLPLVRAWVRPVPYIVWTLRRFSAN